MERKAYRLIPHAGGGFHLGREGLEQEKAEVTFASDTFFSALIATTAQYWGGDRAHEWCEHPPFHVTTAFPYAGEVLFFPKPQARLAVKQQDDNPKQAKALKKIEFLSWGILQEVLQGVDLTPHFHKDNLLNGGKVWVTANERQSLETLIDDEFCETGSYWKTDFVPRVTVDRVTNQTVIYRVARTVFAKGCGLWFMVDDDTQEGEFETLLHLLGDGGIGGDRSSGYGAFTPERIDNPPRLINIPSEGYAMTLSRYNPTHEEIQEGVLSDRASYSLVTIGGYLYVPGQLATYRQRVRMIEEGSILNLRQTEPKGHVVNVRPILEDNKPNTLPPFIARDGRAFLVGITLTEATD